MRKKGSDKEALSAYRFFLTVAQYDIIPDRKFYRRTPDYVRYEVLLFNEEDEALLRRMKLAAAADQLLKFQKSIAIPLWQLRKDGTSECLDRARGDAAFYVLKNCEIALSNDLARLYRQVAERLPRSAGAIPELRQGLLHAAGRVEGAGLLSKAELDEQASVDKWRGIATAIATFGMSEALNSGKPMTGPNSAAMQSMLQYLDK